MTGQATTPTSRRYSDAVSQTDQRPPLWQVENVSSGVVLGEWRADDERAALDAWARASGYADYAEACRLVPVVPGELRVSRLD